LERNFFVNKFRFGSSEPMAVDQFCNHINEFKIALNSENFRQYFIDNISLHVYNVAKKFFDDQIIIFTEILIQI